jgi:hypothetical protein
MSKNIQYVTNADGERTAVIMSVEEYENLLEDLHVLSAAYEAKNEPRIPWSEVVEELRAEGKLD